MATLIETINQGDRIAGLWRTGTVAALSAQERLSELGFYAVTIRDTKIVAWHSGYRFEMPAV